MIIIAGIINSPLSPPADIIILTTLNSNHATLGTNVATSTHVLIARKDTQCSTAPTKINQQMNILVDSVLNLGSAVISVAIRTTSRGDVLQPLQ